VDAPEFDTHPMDWDLLLVRQRMYLEEKELAVRLWRRECASTQAGSGSRC
jgi:hypothetical protein